MDGKPSVALVHDWLTGMRGGEKVLEVFADLFPDAPIYTLLHVPGSVSPAIESHSIRTSLLQRFPMAGKKYRHYLPLFPFLAERLRLPPVDLVLSTSSCIAKGVRPPPGARHACYVHSPMRYLYDRYDDYFAPGRAGLATRTAMRWLRRPLQRWDERSTQRADSLVANSTFVRDRIESIYHRSAQVIHPPVDAERFSAARAVQGDYYLIVAALVPYKNVDLAVEAFRGLDRRLVVVGSGPLFGKLSATRPKNVELRGWVDDAEIPDLVAGCRAFLMPNVEDFGIAPVEAMAAGRPVLALGQGGVLDTVRDLDRFDRGELPGSAGPTGLFYSENSPAGLADAVRRFERHENRFRANVLRAWARRFHRGRFEREIRAWLHHVLRAPDEQTLVEAA